MSSVDGLRADIVWEANTGQAIAELGAVGEEYAATTGAMSDQALRLAAAQDRLTASISRSGPESRAAKTATLAYRQELAALATEADAASAAVTRSAEAQGRAAAAAADTSLRNQIAAARNVGRTLTTYVTAPTVILGAVAVKMGFAYEDALRLIQTQAGATAGEVDRMSASVLQLVKSGQSFGQTASSMAKGLFPIESEGIRGAKALTILKVAAAGAAVGQTDLAQTANALTSVMRVYELDANQAAGAMATLNASVGAGKLHMEDLNAALATKFLPTAKQLGITLPQALAALDVFTKAGIPASVAANNLTTAFIKFEAPTKAASGSLLQLGLSSTQLASDLQRGGLPAALGDLVRGYDALEKSQGKVAANQAIFGSFGGSRGGAPVLALIQQYQSYLKGLDQVQKQSNPATFWKQVAATMQLPSERVKEDVAKITASMVHLGTVLAPIAADLAGAADKIVGAFDKLPGPIKEDMGAVLGVLAVGGPLLIAVASVSRAVRSMGGAFKEVPAAAAPAIAATSTEVATLETSTGAAAAEVGALDAAFRGLPSVAGPALATTDAEIGALQEALAAATAETAGLGAAFTAAGARAGVALGAIQGELSGLSLRGLAGGIGKAGLFAGGGLVAGQLAETYIPGSAGHDVGRSLELAGVGAGIGSFVGPEGTAIGAGVGALAGAILSLGHSADETSQHLLGLADAAQHAQTNVANAQSALQAGQVSLANARVARDQAKSALEEARAEEKATRGTSQHAAALDRLRAAEQNYSAAVRQVTTDQNANAKSQQAIIKQTEQQKQKNAQLAKGLADLGDHYRRYIEGNARGAIVMQTAAQRAGQFADRLDDLADKAQKTNPKLANTERDLAAIIRTTKQIPSTKYIDVFVRVHDESLLKLAHEGLAGVHAAGVLGRERQAKAEAKAESEAKKKHDTATPPRPKPFTTTIPLDLQIRLQQAQNAGKVAAEKQYLEQEKAFLENELTLAKTKQQRLEALQAIGAVDSQIQSLNTGTGGTTRTTTRGARRAAADQSQESRLDARVSDAQAAEKSARSVKQEQAAYERERNARKLLLALYEREAHDKSLTRSQRASAERKAAAERKTLAGLEDKSRGDELAFAVLQAKNAVASAQEGSKAYDRAIAAEKRALDREIAYDDARRRNARLSLESRKKALAEEIALKKQRTALDKKQAGKSSASDRQEQAQFLSEFAAITGSFGSNAHPIDKHGGRMATHLYELVHETRQQTHLLKRIDRTGRFTGSDDAVAATLAVT